MARDDEYFPSDEQRADELLAEIEPYHDHYKRVLKTVVDVAIKDRILYSEAALEQMMEVLSEDYAHEIVSPVTELRELRNCGPETVSYAPSDAAKLIEAEHERLVDAFRIKLVDTSVLFDSLRPVNPATLIAIGKLGCEA